MIRAEGLEGVFECQYETELSVTYVWFINRDVHELDTPDVSRTPPTHGVPARLRIAAIPGHNNTVVQCEANIRNGTDRIGNELSPAATLTVYGL